MDKPNFNKSHSKIIEITFSFSEFPPACKKISSFHQLILEIQSILESCDQACQIFPENLALSHTTSHGILAPCQIFEKINDKILRKSPNRLKHGQKDPCSYCWGSKKLQKGNTLLAILSS